VSPAKEVAARLEGGAMALRRAAVQHDDSPLVASEPVDVQSLQKLYEDNVKAIYRFIYSKVGNREEAEDLTSQVFMKAVRSMDNARDVQSIQGWLFQVARTTVADHWREYYRIRADSLDDLLADGWEAPAEHTRQLPDEPDARAHRILSRLPARYREVLTYRFLLNYSIKETAERMQLTEANVKVLQFRALKKAAEEELSDA
jgi:RNA polymerase sigma-70 factor (ECF subfamily)